MHFFLQGERGVGKSYLLSQMLRPYQKYIAGFAVQRLMRQDTIVGFRVQKISGGFPSLNIADDEITDRRQVFIYQGTRNLAVLERIIARVEEESREDWCRLIYLDEIGGVELESRLFMESLSGILNCGKPCVGVFKAAQNLDHLIKHRGIGSYFVEQHRQLQQQLMQDGMLVTLSNDNRELCEAYFKQYLKTLEI